MVRMCPDNISPLRSLGTTGLLYKAVADAADRLDALRLLRVVLDATAEPADVHVQRLRSKVEDDPENPKIVMTVRGHGYRAGSDSQ